MRPAGHGRAGPARRDRNLEEDERHGDTGRRDLSRRLAPRPQGGRDLPARGAGPASLDGKKIAFLWDYLFRGDEIFPMLASELTARYPGVEFVGHETFGSTHGDEEHEIVASLPERLRELEVDAVISGMGC